MARKTRKLFRRAKEALEKQEQKSVEMHYRARSFSDSLRAELRELIVHGFSVEAATDVINENPEAAEHVSPLAVQEMVSSDQRLPADRMAYLTAATDAVIEDLGGGNVGDRRMAETVVRLGLLHLHDNHQSLSVQQALLRRQQMRNASEQHMMIVARRLMFAAQARAKKQETELMKARGEYINVQTAELKQAVHKFEKKRNVTPETIREIRETYGLINDNIQTLVATPVVVERLLPPAPEDALDAEVVNEKTGRPLDPQAEIQRQMLERAREMASEEASAGGAVECGSEAPALEPGPQQQIGSSGPGGGSGVLGEKGGS